jgi:hypothetical protein
MGGVPLARRRLPRRGQPSGERSPESPHGSGRKSRARATAEADRSCATSSSPTSPPEQGWRRRRAPSARAESRSPCLPPPGSDGAGGEGVPLPSFAGPRPSCSRDTHRRAVEGAGSGLRFPTIATRFHAVGRAGGASRTRTCAFPRPGPPAERRRARLGRARRGREGIESSSARADACA